MNPTMPPCRRGSAAAFTLIELLTVIAIIGILAAILIPTVGKVRESARSTQCISNLRQIGSAIQLYADSNRGKMPGPLFGGQGPQYNTANGGSPGVLSKYLEPFMPVTETVSASAKANQLFACPAWLTKVSDPNSWSFLLNDRPWAITHGEYTFYPFGNANFPTDLVRYTPRNYNSMSRFPLSRSWALIDVDQALMTAIGNTSAWAAQTPATPAHGSSRNVLFYDWHVEKVASSKNVPAL
jgi:prepilin-type N-terminal cleavage/methylation domain-containing protein/prepilin-type processing-associated H-X9-DG protein